MAEVLCVGDLLIDFVPTVTGTGLIDAAAFRKAPGGAAANVAVGLARLGVRSAFMGMVGDDPFGHLLADTLRAEGVDTSPLRFTAQARTALAFVSLRADGEREFLFYRHPSADMLFGPADVDTAAVEAASVLHFDSISLASENPRAACLFAADRALAAGRMVSYDVNLRLPLWSDAATAAAGIREGLRKAHVVKLSDDELEFLTGSREPAAVRSTLWHERLRLVAVTRGAAGSTWLTPTAQGDVPSVGVTAVDTTGAGDGFMAGLLAGLLREPDALADPARLDRLCRFANIVGALTTTERGAIPALPTRASVEALLAAQGDPALPPSPSGG
ncbi:PfkB family carbohydrate kinase [Benzoatithermus flavus]|uniref:PfkB family carbohydrate kinase n=1 Tax=Benzoatithermus flavus TaxID=3108223 RepID=A0ABU8XW80_9PROT